MDKAQPRKGKTTVVTDRKQIIRRYIQYLKLERNYSSNTCDAYMHDLERFFCFVDDQGFDILNVKLDDMHQFSSMIIDLGIHPTSLSRILSGVRSFYRFLLISDIIDTDPTELLEFPKRARTLPDILTVDEIDTIESVIDLSQAEGQRNKAIIEVLFSCGLRVSELCNLKLSDLYLDEGFIKVEGKGSKQRLVPISPKAIKELNLYFTERNTYDIHPECEDYVFVSKKRKRNLSRIMVFHMIKELVALAGIKKSVSPHTFRHSFATSLLEGGANLRAIQAMLGHESISTTEIYMHLDNSHLREELLLHHPRYRKSNKL